MVVAIGLVSWSAFRSWNEGADILAVPTKPVAVAAASEKQPAVVPKVAFNTDIIVSKNLFDPERGAGATREAEENSRSFQRIRNMILLGTVIIGENRTAIVQDGTSAIAGQPASAQPAAPMRLKLGDNVEGYRLAEIADKRIVFAKDAARVEVLLDYFRKVDVGPPRSATPGQIIPPGVSPPGTAAPGAVAPVPRVIPNLPRRGRVPTPGNPNPES
jgi:hypothetical protein